VTEQREKELRFTNYSRPCRKAFISARRMGGCWMRIRRWPQCWAMRRRRPAGGGRGEFESRPGTTAGAGPQHGRPGRATHARDHSEAQGRNTSGCFWISSRAVWDASGSVIRYQGTLVDITEKRKMERQLSQQEEFQRRMLESFPDLILVVDLEERILVCQLAHSRPAGLPAGDLLGKKISELKDQSPELRRCIRT